MCGRFQFVSNEKSLLAAYPNLRVVQPSLFSKEIFPTQEIGVITKNLDLVNLQWGIETAFAKRPIINARLESINTKDLFRESFASNRCLIPMTGFYEWDDEKQKYLIKPQNEPIVSFAGIILARRIDDVYHLQTALITKKATETMKRIHQRMPILIPTKDTERYFKMDVHQTKSYLSEINIEMEITTV